MTDELVWIDLETTGLDEHDGRLLEVGCVITTPDLQTVATFQALVGPKLTQIQRNGLHPSVGSMHHRSGLFTELDGRGDLPTAGQVDESLAWWLFTCLASSQLMLAGSSVHFDRRWMTVHLPKTLELFHYRNADISAMREFFRRWYPLHDEQVEQLTVQKKHRVIPDLEDSITLAAYYRGVVARAADA